MARGKKRRKDNKSPSPSVSSSSAPSRSNSRKKKTRTVVNVDDDSEDETIASNIDPKLSDEAELIRVANHPDLEQQTTLLVSSSDIKNLRTMDEKLIGTTAAKHPSPPGLKHTLARLASEQMPISWITSSSLLVYWPCSGDNGIKLVDPQGEMLVSSWESHATLLANSSDLASSLKEIINCANGVGAPKLKAMEPYLKSSALQLKLLSTDVESSEKLNKDCGADYVKTTQSAPSGVTLEPLARLVVIRRCRSDCLYYYSKDKTFRLMDGDKIATLVASYIKELVELEAPEIKQDLKVGVVQTAYANGNSTRYIKEQLGLAITCTPTGVKHLHHAAQTFDIGTYFEATTWDGSFSETLLKKLPSNSKLLSLAD
ncbi:hypothetical protein KEM48_002924 [Puccinia striiformis f. sp. tritici PST-130]|nr:hypothetical protein KEM48_002924 [Puccinia striiformis f. sp. tritici PST-130]